MKPDRRDSAANDNGDRDENGQPLFIQGIQTDITERKQAEQALQESETRYPLAIRAMGIGIQEEDLARLFQPFVQLDSDLARETPGTGLGLALVAQMAHLHGGAYRPPARSGWAAGLQSGFPGNRLSRAIRAPG